MRNKLEVGDVLYKSTKHLHYEYGELGHELVPLIRTHGDIMGLVATLDQQGTGAEYDPNNELTNDLLLLRDEIIEDIQDKIDDH